MSKYLKYSIVALIILFSGFLVSTSNADKPVKANIVAKEIKKFEIPFYPKGQTKKVEIKLDSLLKRCNKRYDFNGSVLVAKNGKVLFNSGYGYSNFRAKTAVDSNSVFQLASVSKQFTAAGIMILKERNLLSLQDTVTSFFSDFPYEHVTIKHLLNHTAGLPSYFWIAEHKWNKEHAPTNMEMMELMGTSKVERFFRPGRNFDYSNTAYVVLASIIEKVSKSSYADFIEKNIFEPLQMENSFVYSFENDSIKENQLDGYRLYRGWRHLKIRGTVNDAVVGDKNVYSTAEDLFKWIHGLNNGDIVSKKSLDSMYTKGKTIYGREIPYGFGFRIDTKKQDEKVIYHYGKWNGFRTAISQYTESDLLVIVLEHSSYNSMSNLNKNIKSIVTKYFDPKTSEASL